MRFSRTSRIPLPTSSRIIAPPSRIIPSAEISPSSGSSTARFRTPTTGRRSSRSSASFPCSHEISVFCGRSVRPSASVTIPRSSLIAASPGSWRSELSAIPTTSLPSFFTEILRSSRSNSNGRILPRTPLSVLPNSAKSTGGLSSSSEGTNRMSTCTPLPEIPRTFPLITSLKR